VCELRACVFAPHTVMYPAACPYRGGCLSLSSNGLVAVSGTHIVSVSPLWCALCGVEPHRVVVHETSAVLPAAQPAADTTSKAALLTTSNYAGSELLAPVPRLGEVKWSPPGLMLSSPAVCLLAAPVANGSAMVWSPPAGARERWTAAIELDVRAVAVAWCPFVLPGNVGWLAAVTHTEASFWEVRSTPRTRSAPPISHPPP